MRGRYCGDYPRCVSMCETARGGSDERATDGAVALGGLGVHVVPRRGRARLVARQRNVRHLRGHRRADDDRLRHDRCVRRISGSGQPNRLVDADGRPELRRCRRQQRVSRVGRSQRRAAAGRLRLALELGLRLDVLAAPHDPAALPDGTRAITSVADRAVRDRRIRRRPRDLGVDPAG